MRQLRGKRAGRIDSGVNSVLDSKPKEHNVAANGDNE